MSKAYIPKALRERVEEQAQHRCGYCLSQEEVIGASMEIDHLLPEALGGLTEEENLWLACTFCNSYKGDQFAALDPETGELVRLFNPRLQRRIEHFAWTPEGDQVIGLSPAGRATVSALKLNRPILVRARRRWVTAGWHLPGDEM